MTQLTMCIHPSALPGLQNNRKRARLIKKVKTSIEKYLAGKSTRKALINNLVKSTKMDNLQILELLEDLNTWPKDDSVEWNVRELVDDNETERW